MEHDVHVPHHMDVPGDIGAGEPEGLVVHEVGNVARVARKEVIEAHDLVIRVQQAFAQV
ncbi:hypothetical protein GCM10010271_67410 [Streptomyces kurssanovii]|nr:hypothetical protein GCM10010271_67410 [Streptomyces kurssanovii]